MSYKKLAAAFVGVLILLGSRVIYPQSSWQRVDLGTDRNLNSVFFINQDVGWIGGGTCPQDSSFFRTTDGGQTWQYISILPPCDGAADIYFLNESHGFVAGGQSCWESTDGGLTWQQFPLGYFDMNDITFSDSLNGWMVADYYVNGNGNLRIYHTSDGGKNWQPQTAPGSWLSLFSVNFVDSLNGWTCGGAFLHTTDGGKNWNYQTAPGTGIDKVWPISPAMAWGVRGVFDYQFIKFTYDSGKTWQQKQLTQDELFEPGDIMFSDSLHGWIVGNTLTHNPGGLGFVAAIYHTTDGGDTWVEEERGRFGGGLTAVSAIDSQHVWAVGWDGLVINYGYITTVVKDTSGVSLPFQYSLYQNYPNPFNSNTTIQFILNEAGKAELSIYNIRGEKVRTLLDGFLIAGVHKTDWDGKDDLRKPLPSGIYLYRLKTVDYCETKKMVFLK